MSDESDDDESNHSQQSQYSARQREEYEGYDSDLFLECFSTVPTANVMDYRPPVSVEQGQHGSLALLQLHLPPAAQALAVGANDGKKFDVTLHDLSFERRTKFLHKNWKMLQDLQSMAQLQ